MNRQVLITLALSATLTVATARGRPEGPPPVERLISDLALTEVQAQSLRTILRDHHSQMRQLGRSSDSTDAREALREETAMALREVLSDDQFAQFEAMRLARKHAKARKDHQAEAGGIQ